MSSGPAARSGPPVLAVMITATLLTAVGCTDARQAASSAWPVEPALGAAEVEPAAVDSLASSYLAGRIALADGDLRIAADNLGNALDLDPDNLELRREVFALRLGVGDYPAALALAGTLVEIDPDAEDAQLMLVLESVQAGDFAAAGAALPEVADRGIVGIAKPILGAWITFGAGDPDAAVASLLAEERDDGLGAIRLYHAAMMLALDGRTDAARAELEPLVTSDGRAPTRLVTALVAIEAAAGQDAAAIRVLEEQLAQTPGNSVLETALAELRAGGDPPLPVTDPATGMADGLLSLARALNDQNAQGQALLLARMAAYLAPGQGDVALLIAEISLAQGNPEEALRILADVPADSPYGWEARLLGAQVLATMDRQDEAIARFDRMADERPERIDALVAKGDLLRRQDRFAESETAYDRAIGRIDEVTVGHWPLFYARGIARERTGRWPEAEADFLHALELQPDQPQVLNYLGYSWVDQGLNLEQGETMLRRAVELRPDDGYIVDSLGWAYYRLERVPESVTYLERAVELQPDDPVINDHLGDAYWRAGRQREARFQWQRALTFEPEDDQVVLIERKLREGLGEAGDERGANSG